MTILIDLTALADNYSGMEHYTESVTLSLLEKKIDSDIKFLLVFKNEVFKSFTKFLDSDSVRCIVLEGKNKLVFNQIVLLKFLLNQKADKYFFPAFPPPLLFCKKQIYSVVYDMVCWDVPKTMKWFSKYYFRFGISHAAKCSEKIITISNFSKSRIQNKFNNIRDKIEILYCGVDQIYLNANSNIHKKEQNYKVKNKYNLPNSYILCLSTVEPRKNMALLIKAFANLVEKDKVGYQLVIVGRKGWKVDKLLEGISEKVMKKIIFTGFVDTEDLPMIYMMAECFVFPSIYEGFGMPPLEAMACGVPALVSDIDVAKEILGDSAFYFKSNNVKSLEKELLNVDAIGKEGRKNEDKLLKCVKKYSWNKEADKLKKILVEKN